MVRDVEKRIVEGKPRVKRVTLETEDAWEQLEPGTEVVLQSGRSQMLFRVERQEGQRVTLRVISEAPPGKRWSLKKVPYGDSIQVGDAYCRKVSATNKTLRLERVSD